MKIRPVTHNDAPACAAIYRPFVEESYISFETVAPDAAEMARRIEKITAHYPWLAAEDEGAVCAYAYAGQHNARAAYRWSCEVTVYSDPTRRRSGVGRLLYSRLLELLKAQGFAQAYAGISLPNAASVGFHEAMGFTPVGIYQNAGFKSGRWHDVGWWQREIQALGDSPDEPLAPLED